MGAYYRFTASLPGPYFYARPLHLNIIYGLRFQQKVRLASFGINSRRLTASMTRLRLSNEITVRGKAFHFTPKVLKRAPCRVGVM